MWSLAFNAECLQATAAGPMSGLSWSRSSCSTQSYLQPLPPYLACADPLCAFQIFCLQVVMCKSSQKSASQELCTAAWTCMLVLPILAVANDEIALRGGLFVIARYNSFGWACIRPEAVQCWCSYSRSLHRLHRAMMSRHNCTGLGHLI